MTKIGLIGCKLRWDMGCAKYASHVNCFLACMNKKGGFEGINNPFVVAFTSCNGCPGKGRFEKAEVMKNSLNVDFIMIASCVFSPPKCLYIEEGIKNIEDMLKIRVIRGSTRKIE